MRSVIAAAVAGIAGSLVTLAWVSGSDPVAPAVAQTPPALQTLPAPAPVPQFDAPRSGVPQSGDRQLTVPPLNEPAPQFPRAGLEDELLGIETASVTLSPEERVNARVYEQCNRSVVNISIQQVQRRGFFAVQGPAEDSGSGIVMDREGHILTNAHVIEGARNVTVTLHNGQTYRGKLLGADELNDIAVLKIEADPELLEPVRMADSESLVVGQRVYAIGNPFGYQRTLSTGVVARLGGSLNVDEDWAIREVIQIDASINPGNSGGPLFDSLGRLVGVNTAIAANTRQSAGIGFAIPSRLIARTLPELIEHGRVIRGVIGIEGVRPDPQGLRITHLLRGGAAEEAGLRGPRERVYRDGPTTYREIDLGAADVVVALDGQPISSTADFNAYLDAKKPGEVVEVTVLREAKLVRILVTLGGESPRRRRPAPRI